MKTESVDLKNSNYHKWYMIPAFALVFVAYLAGILYPGLFLKEPLTGGLIVWTHLHTMGIITPLFFGVGFYNLKTRYGAIYKPAVILFHLASLYISLGFFLYFISSREGSTGLTVSALFLFLSVLLYIFLYGRVLYRIGWAAPNGKEKRTFEFWIDFASLYFLLQVAFFGFALASNLSYHFFRRSELHSLRLHSHSGITGFWLLQAINLVYRLSINFLQNKSGIKTREASASLRILKYSAFSVIAGIFLWTSVHDRFFGLIYLYFALMGIALLMLILYFINVRFSVDGAGSVLAVSTLFMCLSWLLAGYMIFSKSDAQMYEYHVPLIYFYAIVYGIFLSLPLVFLLGKHAGNTDNTSRFWHSIKWPWGISIILIFFFAAAVFSGDLTMIRVSLGLTLLSYTALHILFFKFRSIF